MHITYNTVIYYILGSLTLGLPEAVTRTFQAPHRAPDSKPSTLILRLMIHL